MPEMPSRKRFGFRAFSVERVSVRRSPPPASVNRRLRKPLKPEFKSDTEKAVNEGKKSRLIAASDDLRRRRREAALSPPRQKKWAAIAGPQRHESPGVLLSNHIGD